ncbi:MAG TPA: hypothetical protein VEC14_05235 [Reyranellaceae bacterium]|nr:hypothetical protein [Reyranellaceae bacterium]
MRRRLILLAAVLAPVSAEAQSESRERKKTNGKAPPGEKEFRPSGGASMRGQSTRPGLRAGYAYRHEREKLKRRGE